MKRNKLFLSLSALLLISLITMSFLSVNVKGANTLDFTFEKDVFYSESNPIPNFGYNTRNQTIYTQHYNATYSFENDTDGSNPINFNVDETGGSINVISGFDGHDKVIEMNDTSDSESITLDTTVLIVSGTYEYWIRFSQTNAFLYHYILEIDTGTAINLQWTDVGELKYYDTSWHVIDTYSLNIWYHVRIDFECGSGNYLGLSQHDFRIRINGEIIGEYDMRGTPTTMHEIQWNSGGSTVGINYIDALGYSWDFDYSWDGHYPATYSFENEIGLIGTDISFINYTNIESEISVIDSFSNHNSVLQINNSNSFNAYHNGFDLIENNETIEFWYSTNNSSGRTNIQIRNSTDIFCYLRMENNDLKYHNGLVRQATGLTIENNTWYHIKMKLYIDSTWDYYINENKYANRVDTYTTMYSGFDRMGFTTYTHIDYFDAIGYSWDDNYNIGDNLKYYPIGDNIIPYNYKTTISEIDKWTFLNNEDGSATINGQAIPPYWTEINTFARVDTGIQKADDGAILLIEYSTTTQEGVYRDFQEATGNIREIRMRVARSYNLFSIGFTQNYDIKSYDDTLIVRLKIAEHNATESKLYQYDGSDYHLLQYVNNYLDFDCFNLIISNNIVVLNVNFTNYYYFPIISNKEGIGEISIKGNFSESTSPMFLEVDSIGVYIDGISISNDFANYYYETNKTFNNKKNNLFYFNGSGFFGLSMTSFETNPQTFEFFTYQNVSQISFFNFYAETERTVKNAYLTIITNSTYELNYISIEGVNLIEGINSYDLIFEYSNIDIQYNYFWVDSNNKLQFSLTVNDNDTEYIQASFNIGNIPSENRSISFKSNINGEAKGYLFVDFTDATSNSLEFPYHTTTTTAILSQTKVIDKFTILITDNDLNDNDFCSGYISGIKLIYNPDIGITIITLTLLTVIVPLIVLIVPSVAMHKKFGEMGVMIMFILMSVICVLTSLIPVWLFFLFILGSLGFLVIKKERGELF